MWRRWVGYGGPKAGSTQGQEHAPGTADSLATGARVYGAGCPDAGGVGGGAAGQAGGRGARGAENAGRAKSPRRTKNLRRAEVPGAGGDDADGGAATG